MIQKETKVRMDFAQIFQRFLKLNELKPRCDCLVFKNFSGFGHFKNNALK